MGDYWRPNNQFFSVNKLHFCWDEENGVRIVLDKHTELNVYSASSLKQQSSGKHVSSLRLIILIPRLLLSCVFSREAQHINIVVFGLTRSGLESTIYRRVSDHVNHYSTDTLHKISSWFGHCALSIVLKML